MKTNNDLLWVIESQEEIEYYLESVTIEQFRLDVLELARKNADKEKVKEIIEDLKKYL